VVVAKVRGSKAGTGLNAATGQYVDLAKAGHRRPGEGHPQRGRQRGVDRGLLLTTESLIVEKPKAPAPPTTATVMGTATVTSTAGLLTEPKEPPSHPMRMRRWLFEYSGG
jgi:hypothetical protein